MLLERLLPRAMGGVARPGVHRGRRGFARLHKLLVAVLEIYDPIADLTEEEKVIEHVLRLHVLIFGVFVL